MTMPTPHFKRLIEDYILEALNDVPDLHRVKTFVRGVLPDIALPQESYPLCECYIYREIAESELTGNLYHVQYAGSLVFAVLLTLHNDADFVQRHGGRITHVPSYDTADELVRAAVLELQRCTQRDLGALADDNEHVLLFSIGPEIAYGLAEADRANNWSLTATVGFTVETEREV